MSFLSNAHTHTPYCDGKSAIADMLASARALGFFSLGFSGHAHQGFDPDYCMSEDAQRRYRSELRALADATADIRLYVGVEQDALVPHAFMAKNRADFDYILGATHYLPPETSGGAYVAVDGDAAALRACVASRYHGDVIAMAEDYYALEAEYVSREKPDVIAHFDLVRKHGLLDTAAPRYRKAVLRALERALPCGALLEVNTGGMARGGLATPYPEAFLLSAWREMGGRVTLASDCHDCRYLDFAFDKACALLRDLGYREAWALGARGALWDPVAL